MAWVTVKNNTNWEYDNDPPDPGGALTTLWETSTGGIRTSKRGDEIYTNCRLKVNHATRASVPNEINKTFWSGPWDILDLDPYLLFDTQSSMIGTLENPTLDLDPANPETLDVITATRAGVATYTDADGLIQSASPNTTRVDYTQGAELTPTKFQRVGYTDFSSGWTEQTVTSSAGAGYLGHPSRIVERVAGATQALFYDFFTASEFEANTNYTLSFYIRGSSGSFTVHADPYPASVISGATALNLTADWQKAVITFNTASHAYFRLQVFMASSHTNVGDAFEISQPQVEEGTTASSFVANTTGSPKFITGATYGARVPMILVEPSATNLIENTDFSDWSQPSDSTLIDGAGYAGQPSKIFQHSGTTGAKRFRSNWFATTAGTTYTGSIWIRRVTGTGDIYINHEGSAQGNHTAITSEISEEWTRIEVPFTGNASSGNVFFAVWISSQGDSVEIAVPQVEAGTVATSFIPTSGSTVTRAADDLEITGSAFTDAFNASEGTFYVESVTNSDLSGRYIFQASSSTGNPYSNRYAVYYSDHQNLQRGAVYATKDNVAQFSTLTASEFTVGTLTRSAFSYKTGDYRFSVDGAAELTPSGLKVPSPSINQIHLGAAHDGSVNLNGHIKRLIYWPYHSDSL